VLGKVSSILEAFDPDTPVLRLSDLSERTGLPRSTVHRTVEQLREIGWLERLAGGYRLGFGLFELGSLVSRRHDLREAALPFMTELYELTHEVVHLGLLECSDVVYLDKISGHRSATVPSRVGGRFPAHCSAIGKAMLAYADAAQVDAALERGLAPRTPRTIVNPDALRLELERIRTRGVAIDHEEAMAGITCVAAPIRGAGRAIAAVSVTGPVGRVDVERLAPIVQAMAGGVWRSLFPSSARRVS
jgi:DNA-binding IclR family transcriptional regulator